ncbi:hypothetical protein [Arcticibacterium luteifluviistationis]|uniref:Uncharacterized protein n=1 Tax=Arcticibacterium luteifluviistationis TaxID=1784714 RepID=A0A2Z4GIQ9_9BACT|nr:hypothetical protein [Arcticibacterium luteifluviistationis]AWW00804.1 hypothetical protein DJ013_04665 [Arcticibacterium luteifluviistationis]
MKNLFAVLTLLTLAFNSCSTNSGTSIIDLKSESFEISINDKGAISSFIDAKAGKDYILKDTLAPLLSVRINNQYINPSSATAKDNVITLDFENDVVANVQVEEKGTHFTFELVSLTNADSVDLVLWGPYPTTISEIIGETVGVVRGEEFAIGIQSLNIKTLGGYPWNESDRMPAFDIFTEEDTTSMHPASDGSVLYRIEAAKPTKGGSTIQAYTRNRNKDRIVSDFNHEMLVAPAYDDGGVIGSKIALFGCPVDQSLETLGKIEIAENLPHPMIDGQWGKTAPEAAAAYIITNFTETDIDKAIALTKKAGLKYLYHYGKTFENWGHFELYKGEFPNGRAGLKACVEKAEAQGVMVGTHFLSNFITPNDPYVTPVPDKRLAKVGSSVITDAINKTATEIPIKSPEFFNQMKNNTMKTVMIGSELIRYGKVSDAAPWKLLDCQRAAFNTTAAEYTSGETISKLLDHGYKVFLTDAELTKELSKTMASLYNETGLRQISFDGLEGNRSTGLGTYGETLMPYVWYNNLKDDIKKHMIIDASRTTHFFWHIYSRMNWGEPWYGGFRESQAEYRFKNQAYFKRNFMPGMLGWFKMTPETSIEDIQWLLAHSAAYDAGYAFVADFASVDANGNSDKILEMIGDWEKLRIGGAFSEEQKENMKGTDKEFSLEKVNDNEWNLRHVNADIFKHEKKVKQPGEPLYSSFEFENVGKEQSFGFILTAQDADVSNITLEINNYKKVKLPLVLKKGQIIKYTGGNTATIYNAQWKQIKTIEINPADLVVDTGKNAIDVDCTFEKPSDKPNLRVEIRTSGEGERIVLDK